MGGKIFDFDIKFEEIKHYSFVNNPFNVYVSSSPFC